MDHYVLRCQYWRGPNRQRLVTTGLSRYRRNRNQSVDSAATWDGLRHGPPLPTMDHRTNRRLLADAALHRRPLVRPTAITTRNSRQPI